MTNTNCLEGIRCPACGQSRVFHVACSTTAVLRDDGAETCGDIEYDGDSHTACPDCGRSGPLAEFREAV